MVDATDLSLFLVLEKIKTLKDLERTRKIKELTGYDFTVIRYKESRELIF